MKNTKLVWSDDPKDKHLVDGKGISKKKETPGQDSEFGAFDPKSRNFVAVFRLEKNGRGGKTVTVIDALPKNELFLKDLTKEIKTKCGVGGTFSMDGKDGLIEIQGDKRVPIKELFEKRGFKFKGM